LRFIFLPVFENFVFCVVGSALLSHKRGLAGRVPDLHCKHARLQQPSARPGGALPQQGQPIQDIFSAHFLSLMLHHTVLSIKFRVAAWNLPALGALLNLKRNALQKPEIVMRE
jgi:hypothetical protein